MALMDKLKMFSYFHFYRKLNQTFLFIFFQICLRTSGLSSIAPSSCRQSFSSSFDMDVISVSARPAILPTILNALQDT